MDRGFIEILIWTFVIALPALAVLKAVRAWIRCHADGMQRTPYWILLNLAALLVAVVLCVSILQFIACLSLSPALIRATYALIAAIVLSSYINMHAAVLWPPPDTTPQIIRTVSVVSSLIAIVAFQQFIRWIYAIPETSHPPIQVQWPLEGAWRCELGGRWDALNYRPRQSPEQQWALDFKSRIDSDADLSPVLYSPVDGQVQFVVQSNTGDQYTPGQGNFMTLATPSGHLVYLAYLQPFSARVRVGQTIQAGDPLAVLGRQAFDPTPHFYIHAQYEGSPTPILFQNVSVSRSLLTSRRDSLFAVRGDIVSAAQVTSR